MKSRAAILASVGVVLASASVVRAQFKWGNVFGAQTTFAQCHKPPTSSPDRIWEWNQSTGEAKLFAVVPDELCGFVTG